MFDKELDQIVKVDDATEFYANESPTGLLMASPAQPQQRRYLTDNNLYDLVWGLGIAASGGGGAWMLGVAMVEKMIEEFPSIRQRPVFNPDTALDSDIGIMAGAIGAPSSLDPSNIFLFADYIHAAIRKHNADVPRRPINAIVPVEAGPINMLLAIYTGWKYGYKVFDCDGSGRAVPSLTNLTFDFEDFPIAPVYLAGVKDGQMVVGEVKPAPSNGADAEGKIRTNLPDYGGAAGLICWRQLGSEIRASSSIKHIIQSLISEGATIRSLSRVIMGMRRHVARSPETFKYGLYDVTAYRTEPSEGYDKGIYTLEARYTDTVLELEFVNEFLLARNLTTGEVIATGPTILQFLVNINNQYLPLNAADGPDYRQFIGREVILWGKYADTRMYKDDIKGSFSVFLRKYFGYRGPLIPGERPEEMPDEKLLS